VIARGLLTLVLSAACLAAGVLSGPAAAAVRAPRSAAAFTGSVGVNTHIVYFDTAYGDWDRVLGRLDELGVRHLRDGVYGNPGWADWNDRYYAAVDAAAAHGMRFDFIMGQPGNRAGTLDQLVDVVAGRLRGAASSLEAPNEYDLSGGDPDWQVNLRAYQRQLFAKVNASPGLRDLPVVGPSLVGWDSAAQLGHLDDALDVGNLHPYTGGQSPAPEKLEEQFRHNAPVSGTKPFYATEAGFHNALNATGGQPAVSEEVGANYLLRTYLEHFAAGIERTFAYELIDEQPEAALAEPEQHFGLLRHDLSEKPSFTALRNLLSVIGDPASPASLAPLDVELGGQADGVRSLLLQGDDGRYQLALWQSASIWDPKDHRALAVAPKTVSITAPAIASATVARPLRSAERAPVTVNAGRFEVAVPADPIVIDLTSAPDALDTTIVAGPAEGTASASANFSFRADGPAAGFECRIDGGAWRACAAPVTVAPALAAGTHAFEVRAIAECGAADPTPASRRWKLVSGGTKVRAVAHRAPAQPSALTFARGLRLTARRRGVPADEAGAFSWCAPAAGRAEVRLMTRGADRSRTLARGGGSYSGSRRQTIKLRWLRGATRRSLIATPKARLEVVFRPRSGGRARVLRRDLDPRRLQRVP
jgi:hypothetical protein